MENEKTKKIWINSKLFLIAITGNIPISICLIIAMIKIFKEFHFSLSLTILMSIFIGVVYYFLFAFIIYKILKKYQQTLFLTPDALIYLDKKENYKIWICLIKELKYKNKQLTIITNDEKIYFYTMPRYMALKISKHTKIELQYKKKQIKANIKLFFLDLKHMIIKYKKKIILTIFGIILSVLSFLLFFKFYDLLWLKIVLISVCSLYGIFEFSYYFNSNKIISTLITFFIFEIISFIAILLFFMTFLKKEFTLDYIYYAIFITPSFVIVILCIILFLMILGG